MVPSSPARARPSLVVLALAMASACSHAGSGAPPSDTASVTDGEATLTLRADKTLVLARGADVLVTFRADGLALGVVDAVDDAASYDPFPSGTPLANPDGLRWLSVQSARLVAKDAASFAMELTYDEGKHATLRVEEPARGRFALTLTPDAPTAAVTALYRLGALVDAHEGFYGLGEYLDDVNHRGHVRAMQLEADGGQTESGYNEAHVPVPLVIGTRGWGLFVASRYPAIFDVASARPDRIDATFGTGTASGAGLAFHLFSAPSPLDVTKLYYDVTGYPVLPARWALGPWIWWHVQSQAQLEADAATLRDLDLAHTAFWIDDTLSSAVESFDVDPARFPDPKHAVDTLHGLGLRVAMWHVPYLDEKSPAVAPLVAEATQNGFFPPVSSLPLNKWGRPIDFTNPRAYAWWQDHLRAYTSAGIEGFKLDYAEDVAPTFARGRNVWRFSDGSDERTMHAGYTLLYHRLYKELLPADGGFLLGRAGTWGDQTNVSVVWPGDLDATFAKHGEPAAGYASVGGLPASIVAGLSLGPSGFPLYGADTAGYRHQPPDKETFARWFEQTALSTVMQVYADTRPWDKTAGFDDELLGWYRTYTRLHLRLFPYEWTLLQNLAKDGRPLARALGLAHPELGVHPNDEYMFGDDLLVAPVVTRGATTRDVIFPAGDWIDWWTGAVHAGGRTETVPAPLGTLPLFLRRGAIVPLLRPTIDALAPTTNPDKVDSYATTPGVLYPRLVAGADARALLFDGTRIELTNAPHAVTVHVVGGAELASGALVEVLGAPQATSAEIDGAPAQLAPSSDALEPLPPDAKAAALTPIAAFAKLPAGDHTVVFTLP